jgi:sentrin-specific protease 1
MDPKCAAEMWDLLKKQNLPADMYLASKHGLLSVRDMYTLRPQEWLNGDIIAAYFNKLSERHKRGSSSMKFLFHNTFLMNFFQKLPYAHGAEWSRLNEKMKRWCRKCDVDVFEAEMTFIPIHVHGNHWILAVIDMREPVKEVSVFDSLGVNGDKWMTEIKRYLAFEYARLPEHRKVMANISFHDEKEWSFNDTESLARAGIDVPLQENKFDCGVFTSMYADYMSQGKLMTFSQSDMPQFRYKMAISLMTDTILSDAGEAPFSTRTPEVVQLRLQHPYMIVSR